MWHRVPRATVRATSKLHPSDCQGSTVKLSLRRKLLAAVQVYLILLAVVGLLGLYTAQVGVERLNVAVGHHFREVSLVGDITSDVGLIRSASLLHALSNSSAERDRYEIEIAELEQQADNRVD